jgi:zinc transport system substrate-binding protein
MMHRDSGLDCYDITYDRQAATGNAEPMMKRLALIAAGLWASAAAAEVPAVVTDIPVVQSLAAQVMGDLGGPEVLVAGGADAHAYQLRPSQMRALADADLVIWIGPEMTPWLGEVLEGGGTKTVALLAAEGTMRRTYEGGDHDHAGTDPHAWLDPDNARAWLRLIQAELAAADPGNVGIYADNLTQALAGIDALDTAVKDRLAGATRPPIVVAHDAFGYFAGRYGLTIAASLAEGDAADPGAAHVSEVAALLSGSGARCIFPEAGEDNPLAARLAEDSGARLGAPLDPEGRALDPGPGLYADVLTGLAEAIAACQAE